MAAGVLEGGGDEAVNIGVGDAKVGHALGDAEAGIEFVDKVAKAVKAAVYAEVAGHSAEARSNCQSTIC